MSELPKYFYFRLHHSKKGTSVEIEDASDVDVVEVVRCADCKFFQCNMRGDGYLPKGVAEFECRHWCGEVDPTDFCSYGMSGGKTDV